MNRLPPLFGAMILFFSAGLHAEPVLIEVSESIFAQGWLFKDPKNSVCSVVTVAHAVDKPRGALTPSITARDGRHGEGADVQILSPAFVAGGGGGLDVALMRVIGPIAETGCTSSTLGAYDLTLALSRYRRGTVERVDPGKVQIWRDVEILAEDSDNPSVLTIKSADYDQRFEQGVSGSIVVLASADRTAAGAQALPLAMIVDTVPGKDWSYALAIRFDAVNKLVRDALKTAQLPASAAPISLVTWSGDTVTPSCPATNILNPKAECGWRARPVSGANYVQFVVALSGSAPTTSGIVFAGAQPGNAVIETSNNDQGDDWLWVKKCPIKSQGETRCDFAQINSRRLRVSLSAPASSDAELRVMDVIK